MTALVREKVLPVALAFKSFADDFTYLNALDKTLNIVIDEYPYLKVYTKPETVDSIFQTIIDNIRLFISGSHVGMMKDMLEERNALYGRFSLTIQLKELNYKEISEFYYAFVYKNKSALHVLGAEAFYDEYIEDALITFVSHRFEELCRDYFSLQAQAGKLKGVTNIGSYYYDDSVTKTNGEFDVALQRKDTYDIYEVKYHACIMTKKEMEKEAEKIRNLKGINGGQIGFISSMGCEEYETDYVCISGEELYK